MGKCYLAILQTGWELNFWLWIPAQRSQSFLKAAEQCELVILRYSACVWGFMLQGEPELESCDFHIWSLRRTSTDSLRTGCMPFKKCCVSFISNLLILVRSNIIVLLCSRKNTSGSSRLIVSISKVLQVEVFSKRRNWSDRSHCSDQWITVWHFLKYGSLETGFLQNCKLYL